MLFKVQSLLPMLACILATSQLVKPAPQGDPLSGEQSLSVAHALAKRATPMAEWAGVKDSGTMTWKGMKKNSFFFTADSAKTAAKEGYENVIEDTPTRYKTNAQLVAALFVPGKGIYLSSIPKTPTEGKMVLSDAPAWAHWVGSRQPRDYHAEDGAMWLFESDLSQNNKLRAGDEYPRGSTMYVYGHFKPESGNPVPGYQSPCSSAATVNPDCTTVLLQLGIAVGSST